MKRILTMMGTTLLATALLAGCGGSADKGDTTTLSFASGGMTESSQSGHAMKVFAEKVEEYSNGSLSVNLYFDTQLGDTASQVQGAGQGTVDMVVAGASYFSTYVPEMDALQLPFMFSSYDEAHAAVDGAGGDYIKEQFENGSSGLKIMEFWDVGFRHLTNNARPVHSVDDVRGLKLRTLPSPYQVAAWEVFGALPTAIDISELYQSLQTGLVQGQENPISEIVTQKFHEIQGNLSLTYHCYTPSPVAMSQATWDKLTPEQQEAVEKAMVDATVACREKLLELEESGMQTILDAGVEVVTDPDLSGFQELSPQVWDIFVKDNGDALVKLLAK